MESIFSHHNPLERLNFFLVHEYKMDIVTVVTLIVSGLSLLLHGVHLKKSECRTKENSKCPCSIEMEVDGTKGE